MNLKIYNALENCLAHGRGTAFKLYCKTKTKLNQYPTKNTLLKFLIVLCLYTYVYFCQS